MRITGLGNQRRRFFSLSGKRLYNPTPLTPLTTWHTDAVGPLAYATTLGGYFPEEIYLEAALKYLYRCLVPATSAPCFLLSSTVFSLSIIKRRWDNLRVFFYLNATAPATGQLQPPNHFSRLLYREVCLNPGILIKPAVSLETPSAARNLSA